MKNLNGIIKIFLKTITLLQCSKIQKYIEFLDTKKCIQRERNTNNAINLVFQNIKHLGINSTSIDRNHFIK